MRHPGYSCLALALGFSLLCVDPTPAINSGLNRIEVLAPGLTVTLVCTRGDGSCLVGDPNHPIDILDGIAGDGPSIDATGAWYGGGGGTIIGSCGGSGIGEGFLSRGRLDGTGEPLLRAFDVCDGTLRTSTSFGDPRIDLVHGTALVLVFSSEAECPLPGPGCIGGDDLAELILIEGLPRLLDLLPAGPQGPQGPPGEQGPPGPLIPACPDADADAFRDCVTIPGCSPYGGACGDCDDSDALTNPRGSETRPNSHRNDGKDNDCNGTVDG